MPNSQTWSDAIALALCLRSDDDNAMESYEDILSKYADMDRNFGLMIKAELVTTLVTILSTLLEATAEEVGLGNAEDLGDFILMEKFKKDLFGDG